MIIGRRLESLALPAHELSDHEVEISVKGLSGGVLRDIASEIRRGEIVGITGLAGSGFEDVPYYLFGATRRRAPQCTRGHVRFDPDVPGPSRRQRGCFPATVERDGSVPSLTVRDNVMLQVLPEFKGTTGLKRRPWTAAPESCWRSSTCVRASRTPPMRTSAEETSRRRCWRSGCRPSPRCSCSQQLAMLSVAAQPLALLPRMCSAFLGIHVRM